MAAPRWTEKELNDYLKSRATSNARATRANANDKQNAVAGTKAGSKRKAPRRGAAEQAKETHILPRIQVPVRLVFIHYRKRIPDMDGVSVKYVVDSLVEFKLLEDDRQAFIPEPPEHRFIKVKRGEEEKTVVEIWEAE